MAAFEHIIVESKGAVGVVQINRPKILNALSYGVFGEIAAAVSSLEADPAIGCIVITGNEKAFAAGADIKEAVMDLIIGFIVGFFAGVVFYMGLGWTVLRLASSHHPALLVSLSFFVRFLCVAGALIGMAFYFGLAALACSAAGLIAARLIITARVRTDHSGSATGR